MINERVRTFNNIQNPVTLGSDLPGAIQVAKKAFGGDMTDAEVAEHLKGDFIGLAFHLGRPVGFGVLQVTSLRSTFPNLHGGNTNISREGGYFAAAAVDPDFQGRGVYKDINAKRMAEVLKRRLPYVFTRTQNPRVREGMIEAISQQVKLGKVLGFSERMVQMPGAYGRMLTAERPKGRYPSPLDSLNYERGDAMVLTYKLEYEVPPLQIETITHSNW